MRFAEKSYADETPGDEAALGGPPQIDFGTKQEIYRLMRGPADRGRGLAFFSNDLTEIVGLL